MNSFKNMSMEKFKVKPCLLSFNKKRMSGIDMLVVVIMDCFIKGSDTQLAMAVKVTSFWPTSDQ